MVRAQIVPSVAVIWLGIVTSCTTGPSVRSDYDRSADFSTYSTYDFAAELGTDRAGYSTLITSYFKDAVGRELESRGYRRDENSPDLIINFYTTARQQTDIRSTPSPTVGAGYYGYRYGLYTGWPAYTDDVTTVHYRIGTANVDVVDSRRQQLVWEGVAEGRLSDDVIENPGPAIDSVIAEVFTRYPARAGSAVAATSSE